MSGRRRYTVEFVLVDAPPEKDPCVIEWSIREGDDTMIADNGWSRNLASFLETVGTILRDDFEHARPAVTRDEAALKVLRDLFEHGVFADARAYAESQQASSKVLAALERIRSRAWSALHWEALREPETPDPREGEDPQHRGRSERRDSVMSLYEDMASSHPKLRRGRVWCTTCGAQQDVDAQSCLQGGWPMHCGQTMTLDSPEERAAMEAERS